MSDLLLEIGLEEIPARMIAGAEAELGKRIGDLLARERLFAEGGKITTYSTPRRIAVLVEGVLASQAHTEEQLTGPSWKVAFNDGAPTSAAEAFAKKAGVAVAALERVTTSKGEYVGATVKRQGRPATELLAAELPKEVLGIYWAKNMYWRAGKPERFVRPVRWLVALLDSAAVPLSIAGIAAGNTSRGHRILHGEAPVTISRAREYADALRAAKVIVDVAERRHSIRKALDKATRAVAGARWREDEALVETVVHLTEWPTIILGDFEAEHLELPEEVLVTVMRDHQKYFAVERADGSELHMGPAPYYRKLLPHFLAVLNTQVDSAGTEIIRHGNERVLKARFKDAQFFWEFDQKVTLEARVESLKNVTFQKDLGSYYWKTERNESVVNGLLGRLPRDRMGLPTTTSGAVVDKDSLVLATRLAKADLTTELVKEFTELQGVIGGQYALAQKHSGVVATAITDQYRPASTEDRIPRTPEGQLLGLADRIQTITAMFGIGNAPTGSKDPFALRRAGNGIVKILAESDLPLTINDLIGSAPETHNTVANAGLLPKLQDFFRERVEFWLKDVRDFSYDVVNAVLKNVAYGRVGDGWDDVRDAIARAEALTAVRGSEDFVAISVAFKRIKNILRQADEKGIKRGGPVFKDISPEAYHLRDTSNQLRPEVQALRDRRAYGEALALIATLRPTVDAFFDKVMVLDPDPDIREQHLSIIEAVLTNFSGIADFSEIVTA